MSVLLEINLRDVIANRPAPGTGAGAGRIFYATDTGLAYLDSGASWDVITTAAAGVTKSQIQQEAFTYAADSGAANAYVVTLAPAPTIVAGSEIVFLATNANSGASTLNVNGGGAVAIKKNGTTALASGDIAAGQIVKVVYDGTNFQLIGGSGGGGAAAGLVLLEEHTAASSASLLFTSWYSSSYDEYVIEFVNLIPATDNVNLLLNFSTDGGSTYDTSALHDWFQSYIYGSGPTLGSNASYSATAVNVGGNAGNNSTYGVCGRIRLFSPGSAALYKLCDISIVYYNSSAAALLRGQISAVYRNTTAVNAFKIAASAGNLASGTVRVYGLSK